MQERRSPNRVGGGSDQSAGGFSNMDVNSGIAYARVGLFTMSPQDMRAFELATNVPQISIVWAYVCLVLNIVLPGFGTMLCALLDTNINKTQGIIGLLQFLTAVYIAGWACSIYWGYLIVVASSGSHEDLKALVQGSVQSDQFGQSQQQHLANNKRTVNPYENN